jgi:hypothetical protein
MTDRLSLCQPGEAHPGSGITIGPTPGTVIVAGGGTARRGGSGARPLLTEMVMVLPGIADPSGVDETTVPEA